MFSALPIGAFADVADAVELFVFESSSCLVSPVRFFSDGGRIGIAFVGLL